MFQCTDRLERKAARCKKKAREHTRRALESYFRASPARAPSRGCARWIGRPARVDDRRRRSGDGNIGAALRAPRSGGHCDRTERTDARRRGAASSRAVARGHGGKNRAGGSQCRRGRCMPGIPLVCDAPGDARVSPGRSPPRRALTVRTRRAPFDFAQTGSAFTKAYGDVVRAYATDDTEELRRRALATFAEFPKTRVTRTAWYSAQRLDRDALFGRAASASYLPTSGPAADSLRQDLETIFERYQRGGLVELAMVTHVLAADW